MERILKLIGARCLRAIVSLVLWLKSPSKSTFPKPATRIQLAKIVGSKKGEAQRQIPVDVYLPKKGRDTSKALPVVINLHGSGFLLHTFGDDAPFCQLVADQVGCVVLDVAYSKAPERPFPNADEDVDSIVEWVIEKEELERKLKDHSVVISSDRIGVTGFSSGGKLALTTCVRAKESGRLSNIKAAVAFYPSTNLAESPYKKPKVKPGKGEAGSVMPPFMRQFLYACYVPTTQSTPRMDPTISPINASSDCFPHSVSIITCEGDSLAREAKQLADKIQKERGSGEVEKYQDETATNGAMVGGTRSRSCMGQDVQRRLRPSSKARLFILSRSRPAQSSAALSITCPRQMSQSLRYSRAKQQM
jgi:acetyl esterase/lipase